jgi:circadian clock protein KaiB
MEIETGKNNVPVNLGEPHGGGMEKTLQEVESPVADLAQPRYLFRLYVSGTSARSALAIENVRRICDRYVPGRYDLDVIDIYQQPIARKAAQVIAVPTLIKELPYPRRGLSAICQTQNGLWPA